MDLNSYPFTGHKCTLKDKLAELAEEVNSREDDLRHASVLNTTSTYSPKNSSPKSACRESLVVLNLMPVSAQKARWERLMSSQVANNNRSVQKISREVRVVSNLSQKTAQSTATPTDPVQKPVRADVVRSSVSQAERERLERMAELQALRQARRGAVVAPSPLSTKLTVTDTSPKRIQSEAPTNSEVTEFTLPPPPSPIQTSEGVDNSITPNTPSVQAPEPLDTRNPLSSEHSLTVASPDTVASPMNCGTLSEPWAIQEQPTLDIRESWVSDSLTNISSFTEENGLETTAQPHSYYSRPKFGAKRPHTDSTPVPESQALPRQRSVTFAPAPGTAPGDTASEATTLEYDAESILRGQNATSAAGFKHSFNRSTTNERDGNQHVPSEDDDENDSAAASDSEFSALLDIALEEAATEEALKDKENKPDGGKPVSVSDTTDNDDDDTNEACSDPEACCNLEAVARDLQETAGLVRKTSFHTNNAHTSPRLNRGNSLRRSTSQRRRCRRRESGTMVGALLDSDCPTPTISSTRQSERRSDALVLASSSANSEAQRRLDRLAELPALLDAERNIILQASAALQQCASQTGSGPSGMGSVYPTPKRSRHVDPSNTTPGRSGRAWGVGSMAHVEANRMLLIACQQRQVLMEELALLHRGSSVLVPPSRGDPIRARMKMSAVRLGLKSFHKPGDPTSGGGYAVFQNDVLVSGNSRSKSTMHLSQLRSCPTQYHLLAMIKCRGEGRLFHTQMVTLVPVSDLPVGTVRPVNFVDLPANIDIVPLRSDFVFTLEIYCMRVGSDGPSAMQLINGSPRPRFEASDPVGATPKSSSRNLLTSGSARKKTRLPDVCADVSGREYTRSLTACLPSAHFLSSPANTASADVNELGRAKMTAFTLLSSVEIRYHDDLLLGRLQPSGTDHSQSSSACTSKNATATDLAQLPLQLSRLPRSSPLSGLVGLLDASVRLEARILTRGFLTVFEEVGGFGVWQRYWCQLRADHLQFWRYPEDEQRSNQSHSASSPSKSSSSSSDGPLGRIDLRHVAAPRAVPAPRRICARANTIFMRSLRAIEPDSLSASITAVRPSAHSRTDQQESLIFRASPDYKWLEQKHLLCADTAQERDQWMMWLNLCLEALKDWMPEHFSCLARFDARLEFSQPVSSKLATLLVHGDPTD